MFEKKRGKRFLASVMALVMLLSLAPVGALAVDDEAQNQDVVVLPADGDNPKPVVTDEENTANTNEEPTPPPANEGVTGLPTNNNNTSVALPETPVIVKPAEVLDKGFGVNPNGVAEQKRDNNSGSNNNVNTDPTSQTVKVAVYATDGSSAGSKVNTDIAKLLGIPCKQEDGYYPIGVIEIPNSLVNGQTPYINTEEDWEQVKAAIERIDTSKLTDTTKDNMDGKAGSENKNNKIADNLDKVQPDLDGYAGSYKTAMFDWWNPSYSQNIAGRYDYHLDLRFATITLTFTGVKENGEAVNMGSRIYLMDTEILKPGTSADFYLENIPTDYQIAGYYTTDSLNEEYTFGQAADEDTTIYVKLVKKPVTITYELNGGNLDGDEDPFTYKDKVVGDTMPTIKDPVRAGYTFVGWMEDGKVVEIPPYVTGDATYTAQWSINKHKVTYSDGVNNTVFSEQVTDNVEYGANIPQFNDNTKLTRQGYTFTGWVCDVENIDTNSAMPDQDVTFTAQWKAETVKAKYFINLGGRDASRPDGKGTFTDGIEISEAINLQNFNNAKQIGYGNNGYVYNKDGVNANLLNQKPSEKQINDALTAKLANDQTKLASMLLGKDGREVVWYHVSHCADGYHVDGYIKNVAITITYDPDGGSFGDGVSIVDGKHTERGTTGMPHKIISDVPQKDGYTFTGWKLDGNDTLYQPEGSIVPTGDVTLVAQWEKKVTLTYHENFGEKHTYTISVDKNSPQTVQSYAELRRLYGVFEKNTGFYFDEWNTQADGTGASHKVGSTIPMTGSIDLYAQWNQARVPKVAYTINQHFMDGKGVEDTNLYAPGNSQTGNKDTLLSNLIEGKTGPQSKNKNYVYVSSKTTYTVDQVTNPLNADSKLTKDTTIDLYYYLDNWKDGDEAGKDSENGGDNIPDCYQVLVKYQSSDTNRGSVGSLTMEVLTIKNKENVSVGEGQVTASGSTAIVTGNRCYFVNWTKKQEGTTDVSTVTSSANLTAQTFDAKGGDVYTFTANFDRSSGGGSGGSSRPSTPPTVDIPDDVPTGLNGKDHYAYIIGYGNNDVRPQNNITRAEVATIFFRLLTDETREANMTKSNGYNDVKDGDWFCCAVSTLSKMGIIKGYEDGSFKPNDPISRAEFAAIAARFDPNGDKTPASFSDVTSHWAKDEISIAANHGWIKGYEDGSFKPDQKITRAETMTLVNRVLNRLPETKDDLHKDMKTWVDNMDETAWYYLAVQEATNSHYFKNKTGTKFEQWTDLRDTRDWSKLEK